MQKQWEITCRGKTLSELKEALTDALNELNGLATIKNVTVRKNLEVVKEVEEDNEDEFTPENMIGQSLAATPAVNMNDLDSEGLPWDERIHTSARTKVKDGSWKIKRGVTDLEANKIKATYRQVDVVGHPMQTAPAVVHQAPVQVVTPVVPQAPVVPALPTMNSGHTVATFKAHFPLIIANLISEGKVTQDYVNQLKDYFKVDQIWMLDDNQKANLFESFVQYGLVTRVG